MGEDGRFRIGVDVGGKILPANSGSAHSVAVGTNTDSVIVDITRTKDPNTRGVVATFKHETTIDITTGIELAVKKVLEHAGIDHGSDQILSLTIGTTVGFCFFFFLLGFY